MGACLTQDCPNPAKGHFCPACWKRLPWDLKAAITASRKTGQRRVECANKAKAWLDDPINQPKEDTNATAGRRD